MWRDPKKLGNSQKRYKTGFSGRWSQCKVQVDKRQGQRGWLVGSRKRVRFLIKILPFNKAKATELLTNFDVRLADIPVFPEKCGPAETLARVRNRLVKPRLGKISRHPLPGHQSESEETKAAFSR